MRWTSWFDSTKALLLTAAICAVGVTGLRAQEPEVTDRGGTAEENPYITRFDVRMGERLFLRQCSRCHGLDARGNDETGAPDLTTGRFANASSPAGVFAVIRNGVDGTAMIPITPRTPDENIWQLVISENEVTSELF